MLYTSHKSLHIYFQIINILLHSWYLLLHLMGLIIHFIIYSFYFILNLMFWYLNLLLCSSNILSNVVYAIPDVYLQCIYKAAPPILIWISFNAAHFDNQINGMVVPLSPQELVEDALELFVLSV